MSDIHEVLREMVEEMNESLGLELEVVSSSGVHDFDFKIHGLLGSVHYSSTGQIEMYLNQDINNIVGRDIFVTDDYFELMTLFELANTLAQYQSDMTEGKA